MGKDLALVCATALICGCATQPATTPGTGAGAAYAPMVDMQGVDPEAFALDVADCRTAASNVRVIRVRGERSDVEDVIVMGVGMFVPFGLVGIAVASGLGMMAFGDDGKPRQADDALQQKTLVNCMARKGYRNTDPNVTVAYLPPPQPAARAPAGGRDTYVAESYAKANFCQGPARAFLDGKGPGFERYSVVCGNGQRILLRCEFGRCVPETMEVALRD